MDAVILAATFEQKRDRRGFEVPLPLVDIGGKPYLTTLVERLSAVPDLKAIHVVTNEYLKPLLDNWVQSQSGPVPVRVLGDGTNRVEDRRGAIGDLIYTIRTECLEDDLVLIGGHSWFQYDLNAFVAQSRGGPPAVLITRLASEGRSTRFGWVRVGDEGRIIELLVGPDQGHPETDLKVSCVYYLPKEALPWLDQFEKERSTVCSTGTFFAWLVQRTTVRGIELPMASPWGDVGRHHPTTVPRGADALEFRELIRIHTSPTGSTWQRVPAERLSSVTCHDDLIDALKDPDANVRIVAAYLLGRTRPLITERDRDHIVSSLINLLNDPAQNLIGYESYQEDEDSSYYVSATAAEALAVLGYAEDAHAVFAKARAEGVTVTETTNWPSTIYG